MSWLRKGAQCPDKKKKATCDNPMKERDTNQLHSEGEHHESRPGGGCSSRWKPNYVHVVRKISQVFHNSKKKKQIEKCQDVKRLG